MTRARWFVRLAAVIVGLANLLVLVQFFGGNPVLPTGVFWEAVSLRGAIPPMFAAVLAGLVASEVALRRLDRLSAFGRFVFFEKLSHLHAGVVGTVCLGGALMGVLLGAMLVLQGPLSNTVPLGALEQAAVALLSTSITSFYGALAGAVLGAVEGLLLASPLAAILKRFDYRNPSPQNAA